jgi:AraC-like DNA-binding protein
MGGIPVERYSTSAAAPGRGLAYWNALASETFNNLVVDADDPSGFHGEMMRAPLGDLILMSADSTPAWVRRTNDPVRSARGLRAFDLHFQVSGSSSNAQAGREAVLGAGDFTLCDASQPYTVRFSEANHMLCVKIPSPALAERMGDLDRLVCRPVSGRSGPGAMLSGFLRTLWSQIVDGDDLGSAETVSDVVIDLIGLAYQPLQRRQAVLSCQQRWLGRARALIDERICDPDLGVSSIAEALQVSPRYLQMLFAAAATTPTAYIQDRRLRLAAERLRRSSAPGVTEVAMAVGFNDLTHFGRAFRRRFGVTPRDYRDGLRASRWQAPALAPQGSLLEASPHTV